MILVSFICLPGCSALTVWYHSTIHIDIIDRSAEDDDVAKKTDWDIKMRRTMSSFEHLSKESRPSNCDLYVTSNLIIIEGCGWFPSWENILFLRAFYLTFIGVLLSFLASYTAIIQYSKCASEKSDEFTDNKKQKTSLKLS